VSDPDVLDDLDAVKANHPRSEHGGGLTGRHFCESDEHTTSTYWPCLQWRLAERALAAEAELKRLKGKQ
jgi:hypothetical protein